MDEEFEESLRALVAKQEITELLYMRARSIDRHDRAAQLEAFTPEGTTTHQGWHGTFREFLATRSGTAPGKSRVKIMDHFVGNVLVFLDGPAEARAHSYHLCTYTSPDDPTGTASNRIVVGRYFDWLVKTVDGWRIRHRDTVFDWSATLPLGAPMWSHDIGSPHMLVGASDDSDPMWARFRPWNERGVAPSAD